MSNVIVMKILRGKVRLSGVWFDIWVRVVSENAKLTKVMLVMVCSICYLENNSLENSNRVKAAYARDRKAHIYGIINILLGKKKTVSIQFY